MHHLNTDAQAFDQRKQERLLAVTELTKAADTIRDADAATMAAGFAKLIERQARLYQG